LKEVTMKIARVLGTVVLALPAIGVSLGCQQQMTEPEPQVDVEAIRDAFVAAWNDGDVDRYDAVCAPGYVVHEMGAQVSAEGLEAIKEWTLSVRAAFPDIAWRVDDIFAAGDRVTGLWSWTGTNMGPLPASPLYPEIPPTGKTVKISGVVILRVSDGKIAESWSYYDMASTLLQLGFTLEPPNATDE
jgi:steroid delta-isomerase-like uncharacterized protein